MKVFIIIFSISFLLLAGLSFAISRRTCNSNTPDTFPPITGVGICNFTYIRQVGWPAFANFSVGPLETGPATWHMQNWVALMVNILWSAIAGLIANALWSRKHRLSLINGSGER
jgi:hypothetical protein